MNTSLLCTYFGVDELLKLRGYGLDTRGSILSRDREEIFSLRPPHIHTDSGAHPASYPMCTGE